MTASHAPGPWSLTPANRYSGAAFQIRGTVNGEDTVLAYAEQMPCIGGCDDIHADRGMDMEKANARLIAASPNLLAGCLAALSIMDAEKEATGIYSAHRALIQAAVDAAQGIK